ncbi:hypothetical protein [Nesterenkonia ebinurensis]|uniref:hypothetical protein n=1 Tax=Nesterenkonia ebinurensis TaxID=2608252 RepID=UPI00123D59A2|nr:hypothetical protein [Nesterenkonia ebinurensis]
MAAPLLPESALTASLLYAVGHNYEPDVEGSQLPDEMVEEITGLLEDQGTPELVPEVLAGIRAGQQRLEQEPAATVSANVYTQLRKKFIAEHGIESSKGRRVWPVGTITLLKRAGGSWNQALEAAGLATSSQQRPKGFGVATFTPEQFDIAIEDYKNDAKEAGFATKYDNYLDWRKYQLSRGRTNLPSGPAVRNHYGSWSKAIGGRVSAGLREFVPPPSDKYFYRDGA